MSLSLCKRDLARLLLCAIIIHRPGSLNFLDFSTRCFLVVQVRHTVILSFSLSQLLHVILSIDLRHLTYRSQVVPISPHVENALWRVGRVRDQPLVLVNPAILAI